jgi:inner membrane protein involved in colicin E2 resistance
MKSTTIKSNWFSSLFSGFRPTPRFVHAVDLAGQWAAPIMILIVLIVLSQRGIGTRCCNRCSD